MTGWRFTPSPSVFLQQRAAKPPTARPKEGPRCGCRLPSPIHLQRSQTPRVALHLPPCPAARTGAATAKSNTAELIPAHHLDPTLAGFVVFPVFLSFLVSA